ncbi:MAG: metalloregulator ArsR/SmtB family transcription factor [Victivallaceae bacterium]|nr:metalloregulator ArsR/SmtB family transcription factor [Victivallaceae bacterium]
MKEKENAVLDMTDAVNQLDVFKALANPARIEILKFLHNGPSCVSLAGLKLGLEQSNLSKQLRILKDAGLIDCRGRGAKHCYFICRPSLLGPLLTVMEQHHNYIPCSKSEQK